MRLQNFGSGMWVDPGRREEHPENQGWNEKGKFILATSWIGGSQTALGRGTQDGTQALWNSLIATAKKLWTYAFTSVRESCMLSCWGFFHCILIFPRAWQESQVRLIRCPWVCQRSVLSKCRCSCQVHKTKQQWVWFVFSAAQLQVTWACLQSSPVFSYFLVGILLLRSTAGVDIIF